VLLTQFTARALSLPARVYSKRQAIQGREFLASDMIIHISKNLVCQYYIPPRFALGQSIRQKLKNRVV
jgi:hypothetical protein